MLAYYEILCLQLNYNLMNKKKDPQAHAKNASEAKNASFSRMYGILVENSVSQKYQIVWHNIPVLDSWFLWKFAILRP